MDGTTGGIVFLLAGCLLIFFRTPLVRRTTELRNRLAGDEFPEEHLRSLQLISLIIGVGFVIAGIWSIIDIL
jgi:hypothetical protein